MSRFPAAGILPLGVFLANYERKGIRISPKSIIIDKNITVRKHDAKWTYQWPGPTLHDLVHDTGSTNVLCTQVARGCLFLQL